MTTAEAAVALGAAKFSSTVEYLKQMGHTLTSDGLARTVATIFAILCGSLQAGTPLTAAATAAIGWFQHLARDGSDAHVAVVVDFLFLQVFLYVV